jgi:hypothetical protein
MVRTLALIGTLLAFALPSTAFAAWDWTTWDMSARDVIRGSGGRVKADHGGENDTVNGWWLRASGPVSQDGFDFDGQFYFDKRGTALHLVRLTLKNPADCAGLTRVLRARHGAPVDKSSPFFRVTLTVLEWPDIGNGDYLALTSLPQIGDEPALCFVRYRPIGDPNGA